MCATAPSPGDGSAGRVPVVLGPEWVRRTLRAGRRIAGDLRNRTYGTRRVMDDKTALIDPTCDTSRLMHEKTALIDLAFERYSTTTFADLGGVWQVEGGYSFYAAGRHPRAGLARRQPPDAASERTGRESAIGEPRHRQLRRSDDRRAGWCRRRRVLLRRAAAPGAARLVRCARDVCQRRILVIYNPQWTGDKTVRLLELGEDEYLRNVPHSPTDRHAGLFDRLDEPYPDPDHGGRTWRDVHAVWQWGITDRDLISACWDLGYRLEFFRNCGPFDSLPRFEKHALLLVRG